MLSRKDFLTIMILFATAFILFISVNVASDYFAAQTSQEIGYHKLTGFFSGGEDSTEAAAPARITADPQSAPAGQTDGVVDHRVAIITDSMDSAWLPRLQEWCGYRKFASSVFTGGLPAAEAVSGYDILLLGEVSLTEANLPVLRSYAQRDCEIIVTKLPDFASLAASEELADFFGISRCVAAEYPLAKVHLLKDFFVGVERIYDNTDMYDDSALADYTAPYYLLREGYLIFIQGEPQDSSVNYYDYPALLWRTVTDQASISCVNTGLITPDNIMGVLTGFLSRAGSFDLYPVVDAQTISVLNYPVLSQENETRLREIYSRSSEALTRDIIWPAISKTLLSYDARYNFFMAPQMDYADAETANAKLADFYLTEIAKQRGVLGLSLDQESQISLAQLLQENARFLREDMDGRTVLAVYAPEDELSAFVGSEEARDAFADTTLVMTDRAFPLLTLGSDGTVQAAFTDNGFAQTIAEDLTIISNETVLALNNQQVNMKEVIYPAEGAPTWNTYSVRWANGKTYLADFSNYARTTVYEMAEKAASFLSMSYRVDQVGDILSIHISAPTEQTSFVLRMFGQDIYSAKNAEYVQLSDSAWLLRCTGSEVELHLTNKYGMNIPSRETVEVRR